MGPAGRGWMADGLSQGRINRHAELQQVVGMGGGGGGGRGVGREDRWHDEMVPIAVYGGWRPAGSGLDGCRMGMFSV